MPKGVYKLPEIKNEPVKIMPDHLRQALKLKLPKSVKADWHPDDRRKRSAYKQFVRRSSAT